MKHKKTEKGFRRTTSRVRAALFNILGDKIQGASFLDLYAGTGGVGFEAIKHGASTVCFVENDRKRCQYIRKEIHRQALQGRCMVYCMDVIAFLRKTRTPFDIIFMDPPYESEETEEVLNLIATTQKDATVVVEHSKRQELPSSVQMLRLYRTYRYGDSCLSLYRTSLESL